MVTKLSLSLSLSLSTHCSVLVDIGGFKRKFMITLEGHQLYFKRLTGGINLRFRI